MSDEGVFEAGAMGFVLGLLVSAGGIIRVRYWASRRRQSRLSSDAGSVENRYSPDQAVPSVGGGLRAALDQLVVFDHVMDLLGVLFFVVVLLYGAWVAPRLRLILAVGAVTVVGCCFVWFKVASWISRRWP